MAKGSKTCKACGTPNGPRSFICKHCRTAFSFAKDKNKCVSVNTKSTESVTVKQKLNLLDVVKRCTDTHELSILNKHYKRGRTWESVDGNYRIRYAPFFMGVSCKLEDDKPFKVLFKHNGYWEPLDEEKNRFKRLRSAIKKIKKLMRTP